MTDHDPTNSSAPDNETPDPAQAERADHAGDATSPAPQSDAYAGGDGDGAGDGPASQAEPPFRRGQTSHVEAPFYRGGEPVSEPATGSASGYDTGGHFAVGDDAGNDTVGGHAAGSRAAGSHDPWATGPISYPAPRASAAYPASPSPWSGADASGPSSSAPLHPHTDPYGTDPYGTAPYGAAPYGRPGLPYPPAAASNAGKPKRMRSAIIGTAVAAALIGGATGAGTYALENHSNRTTASVLSTTASTATTSAVTNGTVSAAAKKITPSVVTIQVVGSSESGTGSGVIVRSDGYILTNNHVVSVAGTGGSITVQTSDGRSAKATIVGTDPTDDLAVIKVTGLTNLTAATFANSSALTVGQTVVAVGAPLDLPDTVTSGIVSATARTVRSGDDDTAVFAAVQTDAAINPGNSGGALVDLNGNVIGINAAIATTGSSGVTVPGEPATQSGSIGIGFAIPSDEASRIANELITTGKATHAVLGVEVSSSTSTTSTGATLSAVTAGGAAAGAGLRAGDVVTKVDSSRISDGDDLIAAIRAHAVKDTVTVTYTRAGVTHTVEVTLTSATS